VDILREPVTDASAWKGPDLARDPSGWIHELTTTQRDELSRALEAAKASGVAGHEIRPEQFPLPELGAVLTRLRDNEIENGKGFHVLRGVPTERHSVEECELIWYGIGSHLGTPVVSNNEGAILDHVTDRGGQFGLKTRGYATRAKLTPHCDSGDIVGLLCINKAKEGGLSTIASFASVYNRILAEHPEYLEPLYRGFHYNLRGGGPPGPGLDVTLHRVPVYVWHKGRLSGRFNAKSIFTGAEREGVEPLSDLEKDAVNFVAEVAMSDELRVDMSLEPGDVQLLCNHTILHTRSEFVDHEEPEKKRLLLRLWINIPNGRELPLEFDDHYNTGPRQGPYNHAAAPVG
jgi:hypothetical protein